MSLCIENVTKDKQKQLGFALWLSGYQHRYFF